MFPPIEPYEKSTLKVSDIHTLYYELSGNKDGTPVIFLHGGPGGGCHEKDRSFFSPHKYKIILMDQRGAGKSTPSACLEENTTWDLIKDIEKLREHLGIDKWHVFGGSWGSTLSLAYAQVTLLFFHPGPLTEWNPVVASGSGEESCSPWHLHTEEELTVEDTRDEFVAPIPEPERHDMMLAYHAQLNSVDDATRIAAAKAWAKWEMTTSKLFVDPEAIAQVENDQFANTLSAFAKIENHYFVNDGFMRDGQLLEKQEIDKIRHIPTTVIQGRYDVVCPAKTAWDLKKVWPEIELHIVPDAGHSSREPGNAKLLVEVRSVFLCVELLANYVYTIKATNKFADL
ncbi:hypothetical protein VNI00_005026 [Paramarasmius palmivorus]|uniref:Proline iminopeptidase n=1 Tax=Paramarasmius palmivorus TaxID=297713 RepID=A0AAW0DJN5_9AGAR